MGLSIDRSPFVTAARPESYLTRFIVRCGWRQPRTAALGRAISESKADVKLFREKRDERR